MRNTENLKQFIIDNYETMTSAQMAVEKGVSYRCVLYHVQKLGLQPLGFRYRFTKEQKQYIKDNEGTLTVNQICKHLFGGTNRKAYARAMGYIRNNKINYKRELPKRVIKPTAYEVEMVREAAKRFKKAS